MNLLRRYKTAIVVILLSLFVSGTVVFTAATFFHQNNEVEHKAKTADTKAKVVARKAAKVAVVAKKTERTAAVNRRRVKIIERVLVKKGILRRGPQGLRGGPGPRGMKGADAVLTPAAIRALAAALSPSQMRQLADIICATHECRGPAGTDGKDAVITDLDIQRGADIMCGGKAPCPPAAGPPGPAGATGPAGPAVASFGFSPPPTGPHYTCTDPEGDGTYECVPDA